MTKKPWFKFYPADWKADNALKLCTAAARGVWTEIICICHDATPYGHLLVEGQPVTETQLSVLTGIPLDEITRSIGELESKKIFSRTSKGVIYSRKLVRDEKKSREGKKHGKNGGNPKLCNDSEKIPTLNPDDNGGDNTQIPEARKERTVFEGNVITLNLSDWIALEKKHKLTESQLRTLMISRDDFLCTLPESDLRRAKWWMPTMQWLKTQCK